MSCIFQFLPTSVFIVTPSLGGLPTKAKEFPLPMRQTSPHRTPTRYFKVSGSRYFKVPVLQEKEQEKIEHYSDLKRELKKIWKCSHIEIVPIVVGALGIVSKNLEGWMKKIELKSSTAQLQKATLLGTARILRKILET